MMLDQDIKAGLTEFFQDVSEPILGVLPTCNISIIARKYDFSSASEREAHEQGRLSKMFQKSGCAFVDPDEMFFVEFGKTCDTKLLTEIANALQYVMGVQVEACAHFLSISDKPSVFLDELSYFFAREKGQTFRGRVVEELAQIGQKNQKQIKGIVYS